MFKELSRLFSSSARLKLLKFFVLQPNAKVGAHEVAGTLGMQRATAETELRALARAGVLISKRQGKKSLYSLSATYKYTEPLRAFLDAVTRPPEKAIAAAFKGVPGITLLVATGVLVSAESRSGLDLLVITRRPNDSRIERAVRKVETNASVPVRYAVLESKEYEERLVARDRLLRDVFDFSHSVILGRS